MDEEFSKFYSECSALQSETVTSDNSSTQPQLSDSFTTKSDLLEETKENEIKPKDENIDTTNTEKKTQESKGMEEVQKDNDEKVSIENEPEKDESTSEYEKNKYAEHTRYEGAECIYTNPTTRQEYTWSEDMKQWIPRGYNPVYNGKTYRYTDDKGVTHDWNAEKNEWEKAELFGSQYGFDGENHTFTDAKDNTVYIWDKDKRAWYPKVDEDFMARYQMNYGFVDNTTKPEEINPEEKKAEKRKASDPSWFELDDDHNTKVYVSNLPGDLTEQEFIDFMQKCGLVLKDIKTNKFKIKMYKEPDGTFKGDALCDYIKIESVELALKVLDGSDLRGKTVKVQRAKFQMRGDYNPALKPKKKKKKEKEQEKKIQLKLLDWRPDKLRGEREKHERTVVVKNLFDPIIFDANVELILEFTEDIRSEASKCGQVRKVTLYDKNPEGVATVTFSDAEEADICVKLLNNRWFGKRRVIAQIWDGKTKYKVVETAEETSQRLDNWNRFLESEDRIKK